MKYLALREVMLPVFIAQQDLPIPRVKWTYHGRRPRYRLKRVVNVVEMLGKVSRRIGRVASGRRRRYGLSRAATVFVSAFPHPSFCTTNNNTSRDQYTSRLARSAPRLEDALSDTLGIDGPQDDVQLPSSRDGGASRGDRDANRKWRGL